MVKWLFMWTVVDPGILEPGVAVQARYNFFRSGDGFDPPLHLPYISVVRVENKIHIVNIECWLQ